MSYKSGNQFVFMKWILLISLVLVSGALVYITVWSFFQTRDWFSFLDLQDNTYVSLSMALIFQYGQGPVLFLRGLMQYQRIRLEGDLKGAQKGTVRYAQIEHELRTTKYSAWALLGIFFLFGAVDAWTNRQQMHAGLDEKRKAGEIITGDKYFFASVIGIVVVFVEEGLGLTFSLATHTLNDILQVHGHRRIGWLDVFSDNVKDLLTGSRDDRSGGKHGGGGGDHKPYQPQPSFKPKNQQYRTATPAPSSSQPLYNEPTYHTPHVRNMGEPMEFKIND